MTGICLREERENLVAWTSRYAAVYHTNFEKVKNFWVVENRDRWNEGPSLKELAAGNLSDEELFGLAPYIEYQINREIEEIYGIP